MPANLRFALSLVAITATFVLGTIGYTLMDPNCPGLLDAAYMTVITLTTVGFGEVWELTPPGKMWTISIIVVGVIAFSYSVTSLTALLVNADFRSAIERRKMNQMIERMQNHIIICGYGRMGRLAAAELHRRREDVVVVESDVTLESELKDNNLAYIIGDATIESVLMDAGLMRASSFITALPHDTDNVFITLSARALNPDLQIIARADNPQTEAKLGRAGATHSICTQSIGAIKIANLITKPNVVDFVELANQGMNLEMEEFAVAKESQLAGTTLRDSPLRKELNAICVAIIRSNDDSIYSPMPEETIRPQDILLLIGPTGMSDKIESYLR